MLVLVSGVAMVDGYIKYSEEGAGRSQAPPRCTKCNSPPINGQCTNLILFDVEPKG